MKNIVLLLSLFFIFSCKEKASNSQSIAKNEILQSVGNLKDLTTEYNKWWSYHFNNISFSSNFLALNEKSEEIPKEEFLKNLTTGTYITLKMKSNDNSNTYKLFELPKDVDQGISSTIKSISKQAYKFYKMEGQKFPAFDVMDLNNNHVNNENFYGKITVMKTWFIACKPCIAEMPELNEFVRKYRDENRIQFISLAIDPNPLLKNFLQNKEFDYVVIGEQKRLIKDELKLTTYPTHIIVDENGIIKKVLSTASELIAYINQDESLKQSEEENVPPPPPPPPPLPES